MEFPATITFARTAANTPVMHLMTPIPPTSPPSRPPAYPLTACLFIIPLAGLRLVDISVWSFSLNFVVDIHLVAILFQMYPQVVRIFPLFRVIFYICLPVLIRLICFPAFLYLLAMLVDIIVVRLVFLLLLFLCVLLHLLLR